MAERQLNVVFIGGFGRSGSTLLDLMLGRSEGHVSTGELCYIWNRSFRDDQLCGCGGRFSTCPFWQAVVADAFGSRARVDVDEVVRLRRRVDRYRYIPRIAYPDLRSSTFERDLQLYVSLLNPIYRSISNVAGVHTIIDSSKIISHGFILSTMHDIDLKIIHLVRDSRGVAYSWQRQRKRPEIFWREEFMPQKSTWSSACEWLAWNLLMEWLCRCVSTSCRVRYEDLVRDPSGVLAALGRDLDLDARPVILEAAAGTAIDVGRSHTVSGNPMRFGRGRISLSSDVQWCESFTGPGRAVVTLLTAALLIRYRYDLLVDRAEPGRATVPARGDAGLR